MDKRIIKAPLYDDVIETLKAGELVYISGIIYTGRDAAHKRLVEMLDDGEDMPMDFRNQIIYYAGPSPAPPDRVIGSIGPTTSGRMDSYTPRLIEAGLKCMIGKGFRSPEVIESIIKHKGVYFAAVGGAAALMSKCVLSSEVIAFAELGTEAIRALDVLNMPLVVAVDCTGSSVYDKATLP